MILGPGEEAGAYWLIDALASYQPQLVRQQRLADFQLWNLVVAAVLTYRDDSDVKPCVEQAIEFINFSLEETGGCRESSVPLLPSEH